MNICRLCLDTGENFEAINDTNRRQIGIFLPEVSVDSVDRSVLCPNCASTLVNMFELRLKCLQTEETIANCVRNGLAKPVSLKVVIEGLKMYDDCVEFVRCGEDYSGDLSAEDDSYDFKNESNDLHSTVEIKQEIHDEFESRRTVEERYACHVCGEAFPTFAIVKRHAMTHATSPKCNECGKTLTSEYEYKKHLSSHETDCTICEKVFSQRCQLRVHLADVHGCDRINGNRRDTSVNVKNEVTAEEDDMDESTVKQWVTVKCEDCDKMFHSERHLERHRTSHKRDCETCGKQFSSYTHLRVHLADVHGCTDETGRHKCEHCESAFYTESALVKHGTLHSIKTGYVCHICGKELSTPKQLQNHGQVHVKVQCGHCNATVRKSSLEDHLRTHTGEKPFKCEKCGKGFTQSGSLYTHLRDMHNSVKRFACDICDMKFKYRRSFRLHMENHSGHVEKPHVCDVCGKAFRVGTGLKKHKVRHTNDKSYVCFICGAGFVDSSGLKRHTNTHTGEKPYQCNVCEFRCNRKSNLRVHIKSHLRKKME